MSPSAASRVLDEWSDVGIRVDQPDAPFPGFQLSDTLDDPGLHRLFPPAQGPQLARARSLFQSSERLDPELVIDLLRPAWVRVPGFASPPQGLPAPPR